MSILVGVLLFAAAFLTLYLMFPDTFDQMFAKDAAATLTLLNKLFRIGFGHHYGVYFAVLMNTGGSA